MFYTKNGAPIRCGLCVGSSDLIGWRQVTVTPDMVGKPIAVFAAIEIKVGKDRLSDEQKTFLKAVQLAGGVSDVISDKK